MCKIRIELTDGRKMDLELYKDIAPKTVDNFLKLIDEKFFDGLCFHRVIENFMIQGGGFTFENRLIPKNAKETIKGEFHANGFPNNLKHTAGVISMARTNEKDSASSEATSTGSSDSETNSSDSTEKSSTGSIVNTGTDSQTRSNTFRRKGNQGWGCSALRRSRYNWCCCKKISR